MIKYEVTITIKSKNKEYPPEIAFKKKMDNSIETACYLRSHLNQYIGRTELVLWEYNDCCCFRELNGTIEETVMKYDLYDFTGHGLRQFLRIANQYRFPITVEYTSDYLGSYKYN